jgi:phosphatidylserine/phosphatidylglycerophosphate/cardiolipin synthase-like enzyme
VSEYSERLLAAIYKIADLHYSSLGAVLEVLSSDEYRKLSGRLRAKLASQMPSSEVGKDFQELLNIWEKEYPDLEAKTVAALLTTAEFSIKRTRGEFNVELVWTGPNPSHLPLRKTHEVLLGLIKSASKELILASFSFNRMKYVENELKIALERGVSIKIIAETPDSSDEKIDYDPFKLFGKKFIDQTEVYIWPIEKRVNDSGKTGSMHVKCAIADRKMVFISSANLTTYAMNLNMEMGVLINSAEFAKQVAKLIDELIYKGVLVSFQTRT